MNLRAIWQPALYHGHGKKRDFFEGWYFKLVDRSGQRRYAIIPGIFLGQAPGSSYAFVQTLDGVSGRTTFQRYPLETFWASRERMDLHIGPNRFQLDRIALDLDDPEQTIRGEVRFVGLTHWPVTLTAPGIMGWYAFVPRMECYHGVLSLDHALNGMLEINGANVSFDEGRGYIEKDWGEAFPRAWVWLQSNHFEQPGTSLTGSIATIPWLGSWFRGVIVGLWHENQLYRFATYTGATTEQLQLNDQEVHWRLSGLVRLKGEPKRSYRLDLVAGRAEGGLLHAPARVAMLQRVPETLTATIAVRLAALEGRREQVVFQGQGRYGGLEIGGEIEQILG